MPKTITQKAIRYNLLPILIPLTVLLSVSMLIVSYTTEENDKARLGNAATDLMTMASNQIHESLNHVTADMAHLLQSSTLRRYLNNPASEKDLITEWQRFMLVEKHYDQIRFIDTNGIEKIRLDFHNGKPLVISKSELQNKSSRYYFREAMALEPGEIYASALDLNVEHGKVVVPYQPTMRFAIQITDESNQTQGLLVVNYAAHQLLQNLRNLALDQYQDIYLINQQGYWILGPKFEMEWGFMFSEMNQAASRFNASYPKIWTRLMKESHGIEYFDDKAVGFHTLSTSNGRSLIDTTRRLLPFNGTDFPWSVVTKVDRAYLANSQKVFPNAALLHSALIVTTLLAAIIMSHYILRLTTGIREKGLAEKNAKAEADRLQSILSNLQDGILFIDTNRNIQSCNPAAERIFCLDDTQLQQQRTSELLPLLPENENSPGLCPYKSGFYHLEISLTNSNKRLPLDVMVYDIRKEGENFSLLIIHDARDRVNSEQRLHYLASHDLLTGLPNRSMLEDETRNALQNVMRHQRQLAILHLDLDNFKQVIDTSGLRAGDEFLKRVAERLRLGLSENCHIARIGNEEFMVLLPEIEAQTEAADIAERIIGLMSEPFKVESNDFHTSISIGISLAPIDSETSEMLFQHASTARHKAISQGGNCYVFYDPFMNQEAKRQLKIENELRDAINRNQFLLYYQPKMKADRRAISGVEALLRWNHPREGLLSPAAFIDKLESHQELLIELGYWILSEACNTIVKWNQTRSQQSLPEITMAVNFSSVQFRDPDLISRIREILNSTGCKPHWLQLEITESVLMDNLASAERRLWALHEEGISIAIDDFGVGYSSLAYLKKLPVRVLKIDRSFVTGLPTDKDDCAIVEATVTMAKRLGLEVVVEGVETDAHVDFLKQIDIDYIQGYWYAKPMRGELVEKQFLITSATNDKRVVNLRK